MLLKLTTQSLNPGDVHDKKCRLMYRIRLFSLKIITYFRLNYQEKLLRIYTPLLQSPQIFHKTCGSPSIYDTLLNPYPTLGYAP